MLDQFHPCIHDFIENIVDVKAYGNCGYRTIVGLLGMGFLLFGFPATVLLSYVVGIDRSLPLYLFVLFFSTPNTESFIILSDFCCAKKKKLDAIRKSKSHSHKMVFSGKPTML